MKLVKKIRLLFRENKSDKVYEVDLVEMSTSDSNRYLVNFRYGRRGRELREGTKTEKAVSLAEAESLYQSVVVSKTNKGYWDETGPAPTPRPQTAQLSEPPSPAKQAQRAAALLEALAEQKDSMQRARLIWNLGNSTLQADEAFDAIKAVTAHIRKGKLAEDYSIAWALGRWRDASGVSHLEQLQRHSESVVSQYATEALLLCVAPSQGANLVRPEVEKLPDSLRTAIDANAESDIAKILQSLINEMPAHLNATLVTCYRWALFSPQLHRALLSVLAWCPLKPGAFKGVRQIFKTAELRIDREVFACLTHRFETTTEYFRSSWDRVYIPGQGSMGVSNELAKSNSRLAYSYRTRHYLRKRAWRALDRLGRADSSHYVPAAKAVLLRFEESDLVEARNIKSYKYGVDGSNKPKVTTREFDAYANLLVLNHILRGANPAYKVISRGTAWFKIGSKNEPERGEAYPHLWDREPSSALDLLKQGRCSLVHDAGIKILAPHAQFLSTLSSNEVAELLQSKYSQTARFALPLAEVLLQQGRAEETLILALLRSKHPEANDLGIRVLAAQADLAKNTSLLVELLLIFFGPTPALVRESLNKQPIAASDQHAILSAFITQLLARNLELTAESAESTAKLFVERFPEAVKELSLPLLDRLLSNPELGKQLLGARLLVANKIGFREIPERMLQHIHGSPHEQVKAIAIALLNKQSDDELIPQVNMLAELYHRGAPAERRELLVVLARLASRSADNQSRVLQAMLGILFRSSQDEAQTEEVAAFFEQHLKAAAGSLDKDTVWRLLQAQSATAQKIAVAMLKQRSPLEFSVKQWAKLMQHSDLAAREFAMSAFEANIQVVKENTRDALRLFDSKWETARSFGFKYFRDRYADPDWTPEYVVALCDSTISDVQNFGREILQRFFHQDQGARYLAMLSQHPSTNVQLFVSSFLDDHAGGKKDRVLLLRGFFVTVLSHINKARICKDRVRLFLLREALRDREVAEMAAVVFTRLSLTVVNRDRTALIKAMLELRAAYPDLALPIKAIPLPTAAEVRSGV